MKEVWKDIEGYEGKYQVSNLGRVKSLNYNKTGKEGMLRAGVTTDGYLQVVLYKDRKKKHHATHRLVAQTFIPNPDNKPCVDHINTIRTDNRVDNLCWVTCKENNNNPITKKRLLGNQRGGKKVFCENTIYSSIAQCAKHYGVNVNTMKNWLIGTCNMRTDFQEKGLRYYIGEDEW